MVVREVHQGDGLAWLRQAKLGVEHAIVTSLPDISERVTSDTHWRDWFIDAAELVLRQVHEDAVAVFYQTDVKRDGLWIDKSFLLQLAAERVQSGLLFHKVVCRVPAGTTTFGRPAYAHVLAFSRRHRLQTGQSTADVLPRLGAMVWSRAMGSEACDVICRFLIAQTACRIVVDPFCGRGTILAAANAHGLDACGIELSRKRVEFARRLQWYLKADTSSPSGPSNRQARSRGNDRPVPQQEASPKR